MINPFQFEGPGEWVNHDLEVLWVELEQMFQLKVGHSNLGPVQDYAIYPI